MVFIGLLTKTVDNFVEKPNLGPVSGGFYYGFIALSNFYPK
jgi:hypothetical protein